MPSSEDCGPMQWLKDTDTNMVDLLPPVLNQWYTVFEAKNVRLLWCVINQSNVEAAAKHIEVRWTIDGNVYFVDDNLGSGAYDYIFRSNAPSALGTDGLWYNATYVNAARNVDKRGINFKVEVRITTALGTNQRLRCWCVKEILQYV